MIVYDETMMNLYEKPCFFLFVFFLIRGSSGDHLGIVNHFLLIENVFVSKILDCFV